MISDFSTSYNHLRQCEVSQRQQKYNRLWQQASFLLWWFHQYKWIL